MTILSPHLYLNMLELNACNYFILLHFVTLERCVVETGSFIVIFKVVYRKKKICARHAEERYLMEKVL